MLDLPGLRLDLGMRVMAHWTHEVSKHGSQGPRRIVAISTIERAYRYRRYEDSIEAHADRGSAAPRTPYREPLRASSLAWMIDRT